MQTTVFGYFSGRSRKCPKVPPEITIDGVQTFME